MAAAPHSAETAQLAAFKARLRIELQRQGITHNHVAKVAGTSTANMSYIMSGRHNPSLVLALGIARALGLTLGEMCREPDCITCGDLPLAGFKCLACGAEGQQP